MKCESTRQLLLEIGFGQAARERMAAALAHAESCEACRQAMSQYDELAGAVAATVDAEVAAPKGGWAAFEQRLGGAIAGRANVAKPDRSRGDSGGSRFRLWWGVGLAASAAAVAGAFFIGRASRPASPVTQIAVEPPRTRPALEATDVSRQVRAFREVDEVFDGHTGWLALSEGTSDVGISRPPAGATQQGTAVDLSKQPRKLLLVRLSLRRGDAVVSDLDVVVVPGTTAVVNLPSAGGQTLRYRLDTSAADPMQMTVRMEVPEETGAAAVLGTKLRLKPYQDALAGQVVTPRGALELNVAAAAATEERL